MTQAQKQNSPWMPHTSVPLPLKTRRFATEPLNEKHAELDFEALMSCRARLREELQWGKWPPADFALELNRADLRRHGHEFARGEAFAYTVLSPDRVRCLGCIYIERCAEIEGVQLAYWVIDDVVDMEAVLVTDVIQWSAPGYARRWAKEGIWVFIQSGQFPVHMKAITYTAARENLASERSMVIAWSNYRLGPDWSWLVGSD